MSPMPPWRRALLVLALMLLSGFGGFHLARTPTFADRRAQDVAQNRTFEYVNTWMGVRVLQYPNDLVVYQQLIAEQEPDFIIETGTSAAGLTLYLSHVAQAVNPEARIITVDIDPAGWNLATKETVKNPNVRKLFDRVEFIEGSSTAPEVIEKIRQRVGAGKKVLVILDSLHTREHVLDELNLYAQFVHPGGYLVVTDTHLDLLKGEPGPGAAIEAFLPKHPEFSQDRERERFVVSANKSGWLRKRQ